MDTGRFLAELKRRRVFRAAAIYAGIGFVVLQATDLAVEPLELPLWTMKVLWVLTLAGFPLALVLAWLFDVVPDAAGPAPARAQSAAPAAASGASFRRRRWLPIAVLLVLAVAFGGWGLLRTGSEAGDTLDANVVAVLPFRVSGADPSLSYLREGMVDLLAAKLTGEGGPRAVDPRALLNAWKKVRGGHGEDVDDTQALDLARELGAGQLLSGAVVGSASRLTLNAVLQDPRTGTPRIQATADGPADSLSSLVDRLAATLLSLDAGESEQRLSSLTSASLPALRDYLEGQRAYREGRMDEAIRRFGRALEHDSTFALAALGHMAALSWLPSNQPRYLESIPIAWALRDRLSPRDRAMVDAYAGAGYPDRLPTIAENIALYERAARLAPENPDAWHRLGEVLLHSGTATDRPGVEEEGFAMLRKAIDLDSTFTPPLFHLIELAIVRGDSAAMRHWTELLFAATESDGLAMPWLLARVRNDTAEVRRLAPQIEAAEGGLGYLIYTASLRSGPLGDIDSLVARDLARPGPRQERRARRQAASYHALLRGRPGEALRLAEEIAALTDAESKRHELRRNLVIDAMYFDGDTAAGDTAALALVREISSSASETPTQRLQRDLDLCVSEQWRLWNARPGSVAPALSLLEKPVAGPASLEAQRASRLAESCALALRAMAAVADDDRGARDLVERLDRHIGGGNTPGISSMAWAILMARLWESVGDRPRALHALRRRQLGSLTVRPWLLREEGRLAALVGERDAAIRAYRHYLALRSDPEPALRPEANRIRAELAGLIGEP